MGPPCWTPGGASSSSSSGTVELTKGMEGGSEPLLPVGKKDEQASGMVSPEKLEQYVAASGGSKRRRRARGKGPVKVEEVKEEDVKEVVEGDPAPSGADEVLEEFLKDCERGDLPGDVPEQLGGSSSSTAIPLEERVSDYADQWEAPLRRLQDGGAPAESRPWGQPRDPSMGKVSNSMGNSAFRSILQSR